VFRRIAKGLMYLLLCLTALLMASAFSAVLSGGLYGAWTKYFLGAEVTGWSCCGLWLWLVRSEKQGKA
jgi:hypothetical protein